jgi:hypothetical protein
MAKKKRGYRLPAVDDRGKKWCTGHKRLHPTHEFGRDTSRPCGLAASCRAARNTYAERKRHATH